jgi:peptide/nickel transport system substrate-binding protein
MQRWNETLLTRRRMLRMGAATALGVTVLPGLLAACGGDDDDDDTTGDDSGASSSPAAGETSSSGDESSAEEGEPKSGGTLVWAMGGDADALDPSTTNAWAAWRQATLMYESLIKKDLTVTEGTPEMIPQLAESWEVTEDGLTWTFALRQGVKFHDGTDFNSAAVMANYERMAVEDSKYFYANAWHGRFAFQYAKEVDAPDDFTWSITHDQPVGEFLATMGDYYFFGIASPTQIEKVGNENLASQPSGTGPFRFVERVEGQRTEFERNDDYWGDKAYLDKVIIRPILEDQARVVALQTGEIDLMSDPPPDVIQSLVDEGFELSMGLTPQVAYYRFQFRNEFGKDARIRQAVSYAIDREAIARDLFRDTAIPAYGLLSPGAPAYDPDWKPFPYDPDKAKELLAEAGYPDGFTTKVLSVPTASGWPQAGAVAQFMKDNLSKVGINIELELTEWVTYLGIEFRERSDAIMAGTAWGMPTNFFLNIQAESRYRSEQDPGDMGYANVENPNVALDELLVAGAQATDPEEANDLYRQANEKAMVEDCAFLALTHDKLPHLMKSSVKGFIHSVNVNYELTKIWIDQ